MTGLKVSGKESLLSKIQAAVEVGGGNSTIRGKRVVEVEEGDEEEGGEEVERNGRHSEEIRCEGVEEEA
jgi:hypothetical protein